jgi:23S rRNA (guanine745-N1)-methyltransferase
MVTLLCPVRGCGAPLAREAGALRCPAGHAFDLARSGYCNLLQPQDRRSRQPGDSPAAAAARRRLADRGIERPLIDDLLAAVAALPLPFHPAVLDVGCGEGAALGALAGRREIEAHGLDISAPAIDLAARRYPHATWIVANADRALPYATASFSLALSLAAPRNAAELRRVLAPRGWLLVGVPGADDLVELREALLGRGDLRERLPAALAALDGDFELVSQHTTRHRVRLDAAALDDILTATYRGARASQRQRRANLATRGSLDVTVSRDLACLRVRP